MTRRRKNQPGSLEATRYATNEDVRRIFTENMDRLYLLSFLLTGDHESAEQCFVGGLEDSVGANQIFRKWSHSWAKRAIIHNAIRVLQSRAVHANFPPAVLSQNGLALPVGDFELYRVLALEDLERFVFVMSVLERYSDQECALLLGCSIQDIRETRVRALEHIAASTNTDLSHKDYIVHKFEHLPATGNTVK
jgi:DNA-directed RNA polymerase specialized sigma24 family protein